MVACSVWSWIERIAVGGRLWVAGCGGALAGAGCWRRGLGVAGAAGWSGGGGGQSLPAGAVPQVGEGALGLDAADRYAVAGGRAGDGVQVVERGAGIGEGYQAAPGRAVPRLGQDEACAREFEVAADGPAPAGGGAGHGVKVHDGPDLEPGGGADRPPGAVPALGQGGEQRVGVEGPAYRHAVRWPGAGD